MRLRLRYIRYSRRAAKISISFIIITLFLSILFFSVLHLLFNVLMMSAFDWTDGFENYLEVETLKKHGYLLSNSKCQIPDVPVWNRDVMNYPKKFITLCVKAQPNLTFVDYPFVTINEEALRELGLEKDRVNCCYRTVEREEQKISEYDGNADNRYTFSDQCYPIKDKVIPISGFIKVSCLDLEGNVIQSNFHLIAVESKMGNISRKVEFWEWCRSHRNCSASRLNPPPPNVMLIGLDSVSRISLRRTMQRTTDILENKLGAVEMKGYTKVGANTFPNLIPLLTSMSVEELRQTCYPSESTTLDSCPFIWKEFSHRNYLTAHIEDSTDLAIFNYPTKGFIQAPVDVYPRPLMQAASKSNNGQWFLSCIGPDRHEKIILDYVTDLASMSESKGMPYFILVWLSSFTHKDLNGGRGLDSLLASSLETMLDKGLLDNTFLFLLSDHGFRFHDYRSTISGWYEVKLPALWIRPPGPGKYKGMTLTSSSDKFLKLEEILKTNSNKVSTPFDIYATLRDILDLPHNRSIMSSKLRGLSLLDTLPDRSCEEAGISTFFCACKIPEPYNNKVDLILAAEAVVTHINDKIFSTTLCYPLRLQYISAAAKVSNSKEKLLLIIGLVTQPGEFQFEALIEFESNGRDKDMFPQVVMVERTNRITRSLKCLEKYGLRTNVLEVFCFCIDV